MAAGVFTWWEISETSSWRRCFSSSTRLRLFCTTSYRRRILFPSLDNSVSSSKSVIFRRRCPICCDAGPAVSSYIVFPDAITASISSPVAIINLSRCLRRPVRIRQPQPTAMEIAARPIYNTAKEWVYIKKAPVRAVTIKNAAALTAPV